MDYSSTSGVSENALAALGGAVLIIALIAIVVGIIAIVAYWRIFTKAGKPGFASIIPFYSQYVLFDITTGYGILILPYFIISMALGFFDLQLLNYVFSAVVNIYISYRLAKCFDKGIGYTLGLIFLQPIFICMLAFGDAEYIGNGRD